MNEFLREPPLDAAIDQEGEEVQHFVPVDPNHPALFELSELAVSQLVEL